MIILDSTRGDNSNVIAHGSIICFAEGLTYVFPSFSKEGDFRLPALQCTTQYLAHCSMVRGSQLHKSNTVLYSVFYKTIHLSKDLKRWDARVSLFY